METQPQSRTPCPTDVSDEEWAFVAPYLMLMTPDAPQRVHDLREVFNAPRWMVRAGAHGIQLEVIKLAEAKHGVVFLPRRWVVERSLVWAARCRRLANAYERLPDTVAG